MEDQKEVVVPEKFQDLVSKIEKMSVLDLAELVKILEDKFGVSASAPVAVMAAAPAAGTEAEVKDSFDIKNSRLIVLNKDGGLIKQYRLLKDGLKDFTVDNTGHTAYLLAGTKVFSFPL